MKNVIKRVFFLVFSIISPVTTIFSAALRISVTHGITAIILNVVRDPFALKPNQQYFEISAPRGGIFTQEIHICTKERETYNYDAGTEGFESILWEHDGNIYKANLNIPGINGWRDLYIDAEMYVYVGSTLFEQEKIVKGIKMKQGPLLKECIIKQSGG